MDHITITSPTAENIPETDYAKAVTGQNTRGPTPHVDVVPLQALKNPILTTNILVDSEASMETCRRLGTELKPKLITLVEYMYNFNTSQAPASIIHNTRRTQELLRDMNFIYPEPRTGCDPYRHPIIQRVINTTWFCDKDNIGVMDHEHFYLMPIPIVALTLTVIEWCICEWSGGTRRDLSWDDAKFQTVYGSHVSSLLNFQARGPASLYQLQCDLLRNAREHAGVFELPDDPRVIEDKVLTQVKVQPMSWEMSGPFDASGVLTSNVTRVPPPPPPPLASPGKSTTGSGMGSSEQGLGLIRAPSKVPVHKRRTPRGMIRATAQFGSADYERRVARAKHLVKRDNAVRMREVAARMREVQAEMREVMVGVQAREEAREARRGHASDLQNT